MAEKKVFLRKSTGLVREIGFLAAILLVLCNTVGLGWQKRAFQFTGPAPIKESEYFLGLPPITMAFIIAGIIVLFSVFVFAILSAAMPRSGGGYVFISRIISPPVGVAASWLEFLSIAVSYGMIAVAVMEAVLIFGGLANISVPTFLTTSDGLFWFGVVVIFIFAGMAVLGVKMAGRLLQAMFWVPAAITLLIYGLLLSVTPTTLETGILGVTGHTASEFTTRALAQGMATAYTGGYWGAVGVAMLGAYWAYIGYAASTFVAGEIKEAGKNLPKTLFIAGGIIVLLYVTISALLAGACMQVGKAQGFSFFSSYSYLSYGGGSLWSGVPKAWLPVVCAFQANGMGFSAFNILLVLFAVFWVANDIPPFIITASRILFAMSFDRILPAKLADINERWHSPIWAIVATAVIALMGAASEAGVFSKGAPWYIGDGVALIFSTGVAATDLWDGIFFTLMALAALLFPYVKKDIYEKAPFKPTLGGMPLVAIVGAGALIGNLYLDWVFLDSGYGITKISTFESAFPFLFTLVVALLSIVVYYYYKVRAKATGVDMTTIYAEIPPE